jgi:uncharacterized protein
MSSLSFPDINAWLALLRADHIHRKSALRWWESNKSDVIAFCRLTQLGVLRLLTTAAVMNNKPLNMPEAWHVFDRLFEDDRVAVLPEPHLFEPGFRQFSALRSSSPKIWADAYLLAYAAGSNGTLVTFDKALSNRGAQCLLLD